MKARIDIATLKIYFVLIPFIYPRGFSQYFPIYKEIMTMWLYIAIFVIMFDFVRQARKNIRKPGAFFATLFYFIIMIIETLAIKGGIDEGLQKLFAVPALCIYLLENLPFKKKKIIMVIANILLADNIFNTTLFSPFVLRTVFGNQYIENIMFVGHVQTCAQIGALSIMVSYVIYRIGYHSKSFWLSFFSIATMLFSGAEASYLVILIFSVSYILYKRKKTVFISMFSPNAIFLVGTLAQALVLPIVVCNKLDFGARYYVYIDALKKMKGHYLFGYGVYGILLYTFWMEWTGDIGMNYAHNQVLQILMDGGIILLICYCLMCFLILKSCKKQDRYIRFWLNSSLLAFLVDGMCDPVTEYNYFYIFLMLQLYIPEIVEEGGRLA